MIEKLYQEFLDNNPYPRRLKSLSKIQNSKKVIFEGKSYIDFSSSDYLGLADHPLLIERVKEYTDRYGASVSSSRLVTGNFDYQENLENKLALALKKPSALILPTGYQTNISVLESLLNKTILQNLPLVFADRLCHSSVLSAGQHAEMFRFQHNDYEHLENLLNKHANKSVPKFILTETVFSMEGDRCDLSKLIYLSQKYNAHLYIDDAHGIGVYGENGWGEPSGYAQDIFVTMGTFSKALGCLGGFVGCSETVKQYLINKCKGIIYSTGISPPMLGAISAVLDLVPTLQYERERLQSISTYVRNAFRNLGLNISNSNTHIIPWIIGDFNQTQRMSKLLQRDGILATAIHPPTVKVAQSRIRFCISAAHTDNDIEHLIYAIQQCRKQITLHADIS